MNVEIHIVEGPLAPRIHAPPGARAGALLVFDGIGPPHGGRSGTRPRSTTYEVYEPIATQQLIALCRRHRLQAQPDLPPLHPQPRRVARRRMLDARHEIYSAHRAAALSAMAEFIDRLKKECPHLEESRCGFDILTHADGNSPHPHRAHPDRGIPVSSVGHAGASGYLAVMALMGVAESTQRPVQLVLNILVSTIGAIQFWRAGHFGLEILLAIRIGSIPMAWFGGKYEFARGVLQDPARARAALQRLRLLVIARHAAPKSREGPLRSLLPWQQERYSDWSPAHGHRRRIFLSP